MAVADQEGSIFNKSGQQRVPNNIFSCHYIHEGRLKIITLSTMREQERAGPTLKPVHFRDALHLDAGEVWHVAGYR